MSLNPHAKPFVPAAVLHSALAELFELAAVQYLNPDNQQILHDLSAGKPPSDPHYLLLDIQEAIGIAKMIDQPSSLEDDEEDEEDDYPPWLDDEDDEDYPEDLPEEPLSEEPPAPPPPTPPSCRYGTSCRDKRKVHRDAFTHPQVCRYGEACRDKRRVHREEFLHDF